MDEVDRFRVVFVILGCEDGSNTWEVPQGCHWTRLVGLGGVLSNRSVVGMWCYSWKDELQSIHGKLLNVDGGDAESVLTCQDSGQSCHHTCSYPFWTFFLQWCDRNEVVYLLDFMVQQMRLNFLFSKTVAFESFQRPKFPQPEAWIHALDLCN